MINEYRTGNNMEGSGRLEELRKTEKKYRAG
jgi:hypothetical protein